MKLIYEFPGFTAFCLAQLVMVFPDILLQNIYYLYTPIKSEFHVYPLKTAVCKLGRPIHRGSWWSVTKGLFVKREIFACIYNSFLYVRKNVFEVIYENSNFLYFRKKN